MIIHKMNRVSGFIIIIITGALVRISEYHIILDILIVAYTAVQYRGTQPKHRGTKFSAVPNTSNYTVKIQLVGYEIIVIKMSQ